MPSCIHVIMFFIDPLYIYSLICSFVCMDRRIHVFLRDSVQPFDNTTSSQEPVRPLSREPLSARPEWRSGCSCFGTVWSCMLILLSICFSLITWSHDLIPSQHGWFDVGRMNLISYHSNISSSLFFWCHVTVEFYHNPLRCATRKKRWPPGDVQHLLCQSSRLGSKLRVPRQGFR